MSALPKNANFLGLTLSDPQEKQEVKGEIPTWNNPDLELDMCARYV
jgi:hypothetical protein